MMIAPLVPALWPRSGVLAGELEIFKVEIPFTISTNNVRRNLLRNARQKSFEEFLHNPPVTKLTHNRRRTMQALAAPEAYHKFLLDSSSQRRLLGTVHHCS